MANTVSKPITATVQVTNSNTVTAPITQSKVATVTASKATARFNASPRYPSSLPNLHAIKNFDRSKTVTSDRDSSSPHKFDAAFLVRALKEQYKIASQQWIISTQQKDNVSQIGFMKEDTLSLLIPSGTTLSTGFLGYLGPLPYDATIDWVELNSESGGSITIDLWADTIYPRDADSITGGNPITLSSEKNNRDETLTGWTTQLYKGDLIGVNVDSVSGVSDILITIGVTMEDVDVVTQSKPITVSNATAPVTVTKFVTRG